MSRGPQHACNILLNWIHKAQAEEVVDNLLEGLQKAECIHALEWLNKLQKPTHYQIYAQKANQHDLLIPIQLETLESRATLKVTTLIDSGCTGSSIHHGFVKDHGLVTKPTASSIPVYNADGSCNKVGEITKYIELHLKI
ncbi:uncharacterized protein ARMOST_07006 [Armillaria ostoyae]|uniref:Uncharacterized protein n=1 Tax=Armillaria ostoyae TaxID=47428 RepID=A0A284R4K7_ARMOS|nr:uncharacterized protein ARMOST_07006 [Armillaria ostoyae]